ncbi:sulfatase [Pontiellaceae bacterium B1224]|nr:sulfatase [Pontiellaceae bacterium B1224]
MNLYFKKNASLWAAWLVSATVCFGQQPNILFIAVDDLNNWTGFAGDPNAITPNMDKLASEGVHFSNAYCTYPLCGPSRASLMSGVYFSELNTTLVQPEDAEVEERIEALGSSLLHTYLGNHGYKTMAVGKILHTHVPAGSVDLSGGRMGWDKNEDSEGNTIRSNWPSTGTLTDWGIYVGENGTGTEADMSDSVSAVWAVDRLQETHTEPFILMVGFLHPHVPWYAPQSYYDQYDPETLVMPPYNPDDWDDIPTAGLDTISTDVYPSTEWAIENNQWTNMVHAYLANVTFADTKVGLVLDALEASPYATNTIVVLWGDHGYHMGEKNTFQKNTLWDRSGVTPLIIKAPGMTTNAECSSVVSLLDLYPTLVDLAGLPANEKVRGRTLKPLLEDPTLIWEFPAFTYKYGTEATQLGDLRYIKYEDGSQELYDHASDPDEWTNLAGDANYAAIITALKKMSPFPEAPPGTTNVFEFLNTGPLDELGLNGTFYVDGLALSTEDIIGLDGSRASSGERHVTQIGNSHGLGVNSDGTDKAVLFQIGEGWEFSFNSDVRLQNINIADMSEAGASMTLTSLSGEFAPITLASGNGDYDLNDTLVTAGSTLHISYSVTSGDVDEGAKIMSLTVVKAATGYSAWVTQQGLTVGLNDAYDDDPDGDGMVNLVEYAMGANSLTNDAVLYQPQVVSSEENGTNYLNLIYRRRTDAEERGLDYQVGAATNLTEAMTNGTEQAGAGLLDSDFEIITNRISTNVQAVQFMQLRITTDED